MKDHFEPVIRRYLRRWGHTLRSTTIQSKGYRLRLFAAFLRERYPEVRRFRQLRRRPHIEAWLEYILYLKPVCRNWAMRNLRLFFEDLIAWQWPDAPPPRLLTEEDSVPEPNYVPRPLPPDLDQAVQEALREAGSFGALALLLLRYTGMRIGEMRALSLDAMEPSGPDAFTLRVPIGKTYSERILPLDARTVELLRRILALRACHRRHPLPARFRHLMMIDPRGRHLCATSYNLLLQKLSAHFRSTEHIHCHRLRHTFATEMARAGMPIPALMKLLGHSTPKMTMRYVEVAQLDLRQAYDQALAQLAILRSVQPPPATALPRPSSDLLTQPEPEQFLLLLDALIGCMENHRRDLHDPARAQQLHRFIQRIRKTQHDLKKSL